MLRCSVTAFVKWHFAKMVSSDSSGNIRQGDGSFGVDYVAS
jgi:hypothetical protein